MVTKLSLHNSDFYRFTDESMENTIFKYQSSNTSPTISSSQSDGFSNPFSIEDSPLSSPSDIECFQPGEEGHTSIESKSGSRKTVIRRSASLPAGVRLPQRKGGMHLWQFLYSILQLPDKYSHLIEWTSYRKEFEFRLVEPDAIAVWWGYHKNKKNMSYDKLSRSLRYYYDKQIIRKIGGERYVYRFCVDPEVMYKAIGNSENRPKLKPMPKSAENMLLKNQHARNSQSQIQSPPAKTTFVVEEADVLSHGAKSESLLSTSLSSKVNMPFPSIQSYTMSNGNHHIECAMRLDDIKEWQTQGKVTSPYHSDLYQDFSYLYQMYPTHTGSQQQCLPPSLVPAMSESTFMSEDDAQNPCTSEHSRFVTYHNGSIDTSSIPEASLNAYTDSSSYYSVNPLTTFVPESDHEYASLPSTIDSIATCNELHHGSLPLVYHHDVNNAPLYAAVYDNPAASWPLVANTNSISSDFSTW